MEEQTMTPWRDTIRRCRTAAGRYWPGGRVGAYVALVSLAGLAALAYAVATLPQSDALLIGLLVVASALIQAAPIPLQGTALEGASLSVTSALSFAGLLIWGPAGAILINLGSAVMSSVYPQRRPLFKTSFNTATLLLSALTAGIVYWLLGGLIPIEYSVTNILAAIAAALAYFAANTGLVSGAISLTTGRPIREVWGNWQWLAIQYLTTFAVGVTMALAYLQIGLGGFALLGVPLALPWYSIRLYVTKTKQVAEQNEALRLTNDELDRINRQLDRRLQELRAVHGIGISLNSAHGLERVLEQILTEAVGLIGADAAAVFLYAREVAGHQPNGGPHSRLEIAGQVGLSEAYLATPDLALNGSAARALAEARRLLMDEAHQVPDMLSAPASQEGIQAAACLPLVVTNQVVGGLDICFKGAHTYTEEELDILSTLAEQAAVAIHNAQLLEKVHESYLSTIRALAATVEAKDPYTRGHSEAVRRLAVATGRQLGLDPQTLERLSLAALFHDIGKIGIPDSVLLKPGRLDEDEWALMQQHPILAENILRHVLALADLIPVIRHHHERYDATGYPDGIPVQEEPLAAIIGVADTYQAMTSDRPYRKALSHASAVEELRRSAGTQLVPEVVEAFIEAVEPSRKITQLEDFRLEPVLLAQRAVSSLSRGRYISQIPAEHMTQCPSTGR